MPDLDFRFNKIPLNIEIRLAILFLILFALIVLIYPSKTIENEQIISPISSKEIVHGDKQKRQIIFTFDGGGADLSGQKILETLAKHKIKSSFFLTGKFVENNPDLVIKINNEGHEIYNHTYDHPYLTKIRDEEIAIQLQKMEQALIKITGVSPKPYFRPPYGDRDLRVLKSAFEQGYQSVYWTVDAMDWQEREGKTGWEVKDIILSSLAPGNIYLMHLGDTITGNILDELFTEIKSRGYEIVSLKQGL